MKRSVIFSVLCVFLVNNSAFAGEFFGNCCSTSSNSPVMPNTQTTTHSAPLAHLATGVAHSVADTTPVSPIFPTTEPEQMRALHNAVANRDFDRVRELLVTAHINVNLRDPGNEDRTAIFLETTTDIRALLIREGADLELTDRTGSRPAWHDRNPSGYLNLNAPELPTPRFRSYGARVHS